MSACLLVTDLKTAINRVRFFGSVVVGGDFIRLPPEA